MSVLETLTLCWVFLDFIVYLSVADTLLHNSSFLMFVLISKELHPVTFCNNGWGLFDSVPSDSLWLPSLLGYNPTNPPVQNHQLETPCILQHDTVTTSTAFLFWVCKITCIELQVVFWPQSPSVISIFIQFLLRKCY